MRVYEDATLCCDCDEDDDDGACEQGAGDLFSGMPALDLVHESHGASSSTAGDATPPASLSVPNRLCFAPAAKLVRSVMGMAAAVFPVLHSKHPELCGAYNGIDKVPQHAVTNRCVAGAVGCRQVVQQAQPHNATRRVLSQPTHCTLPLHLA